MAEYTTEELREQMVRAGSYFGKALRANRKTWVGTLLEDGTLVLVARGVEAERLAGVLDANLGAGRIERQAA